MSNIAKGIAQYLLGETSVTTLCGTRIVLGALKQGISHPAVTIRKVSDVPENHIGGAGTLYTARLQIDCYADNESAANGLGNEIDTLLNGETGTWGSHEVVDSNLENRQDFYEAPVDGSDKARYGESLEFLITYVRS